MPALKILNTSSRGESRAVETPCGARFLIDESDAPLVMAYTWSLLNGAKAYVRTCYAQQTIYLHRFLADAPKGFEVDHINGDGLDNRRSNLRVCLHENNTCNRRPTSGRVLPLGVDEYFPGRFRVRLRDKVLGIFGTIEEAEIAYGIAAREAFGEFAPLCIREAATRSQDVA